MDFANSVGQVSIPAGLLCRIGGIGIPPYVFQFMDFANSVGQVSIPASLLWRIGGIGIPPYSEERINSVGRVPW
jgi:hypothetical protein